MQETDNTVLMRGNPLTLVGSALKVGDSAPDFMVVDNDMKPISLKDFAGKALIICCFRKKSFQLTA